MGYCTVEDIEKRFLNIDFTTSTSVSTSDVEAFISLNSAEIDGRLESVYEIPITGTKALLIVQKICEFLTLADVQEILDQKGMGNDDVKTTSQKYREIAEKMLISIENGVLALTDAVSLATDAFINSNNSSNISFVIKKDTRQW
jgi:phage gp36-like protein